MIRHIKGFGGNKKAQIFSGYLEFFLINLTTICGLTIWDYLAVIAIVLCTGEEVFGGAPINFLPHQIYALRYFYFAKMKVPRNLIL